METKTISLPQTTTRVFEYTLIALSFLIPFFISGPQLLTGTIVNTLLFLFVAKSKSKNAAAMVMLPSIGAVLNGVLFGKFTYALLYFLPFIWVGNYILIRVFRMVTKNNSFIVSVGMSSLMKSMVLFAAAYVLTQAKIVPGIFLQLMGLFQLYTALLGGVMAFIVTKIKFQKP